MPFKLKPNPFLNLDFFQRNKKAWLQRNLPSQEPGVKNEGLKYERVWGVYYPATLQRSVILGWYIIGDAEIVKNGPSFWH